MNERVRPSNGASYRLWRRRWTYPSLLPPPGDGNGLDGSVRVKCRIRYRRVRSEGSENIKQDIKLHGPRVSVYNAPFPFNANPSLFLFFFFGFLHVVNGRHNTPSFLRYKSTLRHVFTPILLYAFVRPRAQPSLRQLYAVRLGRPGRPIAHGPLLVPNGARLTRESRQLPVVAHEILEKKTHRANNIRVAEKGNSFK